MNRMFSQIQNIRINTKAMMIQKYMRGYAFMMKF